MSDPYYLTDGSHVFITAPTGAGAKFGGKTVLSNWWVQRAVESGWFDLGLVFNPKGHAFIDGQQVKSLKGLAQSYQAGYRRFNYIPFDDVEAEHTQVMETLQQLPGKKIVAHDECHEYGDSEMLDWCFRQGGNVEDSVKFDTGNIRSLAISQHPWDLPEGVTNNVPLFVLVGPPTQQAQRYFDVMQIGGAFDAIPDDLEPYCWSVVDGGEYIRSHAPVPEEYA